MIFSFGKKFSLIERLIFFREIESASRHSIYDIVYANPTLLLENYSDDKNSRMVGLKIQSAEIIIDIIDNRFYRTDIIIK